MTTLTNDEIAASALCSFSVLCPLVQRLLDKQVLTTEDAEHVFEAALSSLERLANAEDPAVRLSRALVDEQARLMLQGRRDGRSTR
jgi:hypothetical protein